MAQLEVVAEKKEEPNSSGMVDDCDTRTVAATVAATVAKVKVVVVEKNETNDEYAWCYC